MKKIVLWVLIPLLVGCAAKIPQTMDETLKSAAGRRGFLVGAAIEPEFLEDSTYSEVLSQNFNFITPENKMKWINIHPGQNIYDFSGGDALVEFAEENNMLVRGHTLVWHSQNPAWLEEGDWTREELMAILKDHIQTVAGHYKGQIYAWDVVNEAFDGAEYRDSIWYRMIGPEYLAMAFQWAHEADPDALLYYNDYSAEEINLKSNKIYSVVQEWQAEGVPIDGVGFQMHLDLSSRFDFESFYMNLKRFTDLGLRVDVTELDIRIKEPVLAYELEKQAEWYSRIMEILMDLPRADVLTTWGFTDLHSWIPSFFNGFGSGLLFDENYQAKPAYNNLLESLQNGPVELNYRSSPEEGASLRNRIYPFSANRAVSQPLVDGLVDEGEWDGAVVYPFLYNQLDSGDLRLPRDSDDISGDWRILFSGNLIYGLVNRRDDTTVMDHELDYENDNLEVFFELDGMFTQMRTVVGEGWKENYMDQAKAAVWSEDGRILEFMIELPQSDLAGLVIGWNIALSDNDLGAGSSRDCQLYPLNGHNLGWQGQELGEINFEGSTPRPSPVPKIPVPFEAVAATSEVVVDGLAEQDEWAGRVKYSLGFNQLSGGNQTSINPGDLFSYWSVQYFDNTLYGWVHIEDDIRVTSETDSWLNDSLEVFFETEGGFVQLRTIVGADWEASPFEGDQTAVWSDDGQDVEFSIKLPMELGYGTIMDWNIAVSDNDEGQGLREAQLYPISGYNDSWEGKNLAELLFQ